MKFNAFGVQFYISFTFAAYITLLLLIDKTGLIIPVLISNAIHELGHATALNVVKCKIIKLSLTPGGCIITVPPYKNKKQEVFVSLMGPLYNMTAALIFTIIWLLLDFNGCFVAAVINMGLGAFNLLPIKGLDAGNIFYILLYDKTPNTCKVISLIFSILVYAFFIISFITYGVNTSFIIVAVYLFCCAAFKI